jgi:hypothetical protein
MEIKDVVRETKKELKTKRINLKITKSVSEWLTEKNISPQKVFDLTIEDLMGNK